MRHTAHSDFLMPRFDRHHFNNPMNGLFRLSPMEEWSPSGTAALMNPALDLEEDKHSYEITVELPGMKREELEVEVYDNGLVIRGEKKSKSRSEDRRSRWAERHYGSFERALPLPADADVESVDARFKDGVLTIVLPKTGDGPKPMSIDIQ